MNIIDDETFDQLHADLACIQDYLESGIGDSDLNIQDIRMIMHRTVKVIHAINDEVFDISCIVGVE